MQFPNQNNIYFNGTFLSGANSITTGNIFRTQGFGKISLVMEGINDSSGNAASFTGIVQVIVHPSQITWVPIFTGIFNSKNNAILNQTLGQFDAVRVVVNPYASGICNVWFTASQT